MKGEGGHEKTDSFAEGLETFSRNNGKDHQSNFEDGLDG
jgi:hypothetical protein